MEFECVCFYAFPSEDNNSPFRTFGTIKGEKENFKNKSKTGNHEKRFHENKTIQFPRPFQQWQLPG